MGIKTSILVKILNDEEEDIDVRKAVAHVLGEIGDETVVGPLGRAGGDTSSIELQNAAKKAIALINP